MDHPYNHQSRYVSIPSPNPNLYGGQIYQHNHLRPPPPTPPQPPSVPLLPLPPPPPPPVTPRAPIQQQFHQHRFPPQSLTQTKYNSHHAQFALDPNPNPNLNSGNQNREHHQQQALELSRRIPVDDDRRHHHHHHHQHHQHHRLLPEFEVWTESWNPSRIMTDHRSTVTNFERHHQPDQRPISPYRCTDKARHEVVTNYRYRERYGNDVLESEYGNGNNKQRAEFVQRRNHILSDSDRSNSVTSGPLYTSHFDTNELTRSNVRDRLLERQPLKDREVHDSLPELGTNNENGGDRVRFFNGKLDFYGSDSGRYGNNKGSRDNSYEHNRTPRKQVQKKSALLRIQKPYHRNRDNNQLHYPGYFDESKGGSFRGKDQLLYSDDGVGDNEARKRSSVELDVSFKSNSLVAAVVSDTNLTPKSGKIRKIEVSDKDCSSSQMNKVHNDNIKLDSSRNMGNNAFCSNNKESQRSEKKVANSVTAYTHEDNPLPLFVTDDSLNKNSAERLKSIVLGKDSSSATSKKSFPTKKKKIFTKVVIKNPNLHLSSQPPEKPVEPFKADDSILDAPAASGLEKGVKSSEKKCAPADMSSANVVDLHPPNETFPNSNKNKEDGSQQAAMVSKEVITDVGSAQSSVTKKSLPLKKKRVVRKAVLKASSGLHSANLSLTKKPGDSTSDAPADSAPENGMKSLKVEHASGGTYSAVVDLQTVNELTDLGYNDIEGESLQAVVAEETSPNLDSGGSCDTMSKRERNGSIPPLASSSSREVNSGENSKMADNSLCMINTDKEIPESLNVTTISDDGGAEGATKRFSYNEDSSLFENSVRNYSSDVSYPVREISGSDQLSSEGKKEHGVHVIAGSFSHGLNTVEGFTFDLIGSQEKITDSGCGTVDCFSKESCEVDINALDNATTVEEHPSVILPARSSEFSALSSSEGTGILSVSVQADCSNHEPGGIPSSDNADINLKKSHNSDDNSNKQLSTNGVFISRKNGASDGILNTMVTERGLETDMHVTTNENEVTKSLFDLSVANVNDMQVVSAKTVSSTEYVDTTLSTSPQDISPSEVYVPESLDVGLQSCTDGLCSISGNSEAKVSVMSDFAGTSPEKSKRRKISDSHSGFTMPTTHPVKEVLISDMDTICTTSVPFCPEGIPVLHANSSDELLSNVVVSVSQDSGRNMVDGLESKHPRIDSFSGHKQLDGSKAPSCCPTDSGGELIANTVKIMDENNLIEEVLCEKRSKEEVVDAVAAEKQITECSEVTKHKAPSENHSQDLNQRLPGTDVDSAWYSLEKDDLALISAYVSPSAANDDEVSTTNSHDEMMKHNILSDMGSPEIVSSFPVTQRLNSKASTRQISNEEVSRTDKMQTDQPVTDGSYDIGAHASSSEYTKRNLQSDDGFESAHLVVSRTGPLISQDVTCIAQNSNSVGEVHRNKNRQNFAVSRTHPCHSSSLFTVSKSNSAASRVSKPRTWHRKDSSASTSGNRPFLSSVSSQSQLMKRDAKFESMSYIRKGNSLVRRAASIAALPQVPHDVTLSMNQLNSGELKKITVSNNKVDAIDSAASLKAGGTNALIERPRTPPLPPVNKMEDHSTSSSGDRTCSLLPEPLPSGDSENTSGSQKSLENIDVHSLSNDASEILETPVNRAGLVNSLECQGQMNDGTSATSVVKRLTYLKRKANQLVAASTNSSLSAQSADKSRGSVSDGYYKRRKNQLIRSSFESQKNQALTLSGDTSVLEGRTALKKINKSSTNRRSSRAITKICKPSRFSLVWTLSGTQSSKKENHSSYYNEILPYLFPWKRASYRKSAVQTSASISNNSSISSIGRKLLLLRKRDMIYTRSNHGFSLRKSKVLSVGGCSLKWSKSIERHSKKASKEATMAVAAVGMKKREGGAKSCPSETKSKTNPSRERIFRIGSVRYKMDSSGRTLQRISDNETPCSVAVNSVKSGKQLYIPRRLLIGNDEYVRIGNGNQLVRDPKKRTRILASEKVRWSLHTARMRLARKRKYCQFFTRFGKCNKGDGKCPYIHDSSKIAVCTKFLNGLCSGSNCKLTHKVIPERMPDCSYFLQGLCTNKNCPYRHVHVNPNASTCEGFLKGYCADGNECRKKHSYVCPSFEAMGSCSLGSKCKLHHPKSRSKTKKRKRSSEKNTRGRYFGTMHTDDSVLRITLMETSTTENVTDTTTEGSYLDYISLDSSDGEGETNIGINEQTVYDSDASDLQFDDLDEMIKPIRLMESMRT